MPPIRTGRILPTFLLVLLGRKSTAAPPFSSWVYYGNLFRISIVLWEAISFCNVTVYYL